MKGSKGMCWLILLTALLTQIMRWVSVSASSRSFIADNHLARSPLPADLHPGPRLSPQATTSSMEHDGLVHHLPTAEYFKYKESKIGSSPPSCDGKCYGCSPCEAIQVPTITSGFGLQYANYEPEGWKCKCGPLFYSP